jgi:hypothetical protein
MCGWLSAEMARASRSKRSPNLSFSILTATVRWTLRLQLAPLVNQPLPGFVGGSLSLGDTVSKFTRYGTAVRYTAWRLLVRFCPVGAVVSFYF